MLAVSGRLNHTLGGADSGELLFKEGEVINPARDFFRPNRVQADHPVYTASTRRSIYLPVVRNAVPDVLVQQTDSDALQRPADRAHLGDDVDAVGVVLDHAL